MAEQKPKASTYSGQVVFVEGVHYPADKDGNADKSRPLRWVKDATYRDASEGEPFHNDVHHEREAGLEPGSEG